MIKLKKIYILQLTGHQIGPSCTALFPNAESRNVKVANGAMLTVPHSFDGSFLIDAPGFKKGAPLLFFSISHLKKLL